MYSEVEVGTSLIGGRRTIDLLIEEPKTKKVIGLECKFQASSGSAQDKVIYSVEDLNHLRIPACLVYAGSGFSPEINNFLMTSPMTAYCYPSKNLERQNRHPSSKKKEISPVSTRQLDLTLAIYFDWWDLILDKKTPFKFDKSLAESAAQELDVHQENQRKKGSQEEINLFEDGSEQDS